ncbi:MAG: imidazole glycerol phosphate synthase glutamine amidotransferase subunit [Bradymonadia bacterium]|jgi:imidazole glycerol phosphate synthase glutamine amidotransferase subunit
MSVFIVDTGVANTASVAAALERLGIRSQLTKSADDVRSAQGLVLPGVGTFAAGMAALESAGLVEVVRERILADRPTFCVCLGMQLLAARSEESPGVDGIGILDVSVSALPQTVRTPQMGWNQVTAFGGLEAGPAYFANSFSLDRAPDGWSTGLSTHGREFPAAIAKGNVMACQFHPELSGDYGAYLMASWASRFTGVVPQPPKAELRTDARLIPCLDVRDGRVVKGIQFQQLRDAGDPVECALRYEESGADELVVLDVSATAEGRAARGPLIRKIRSVLRIPMTVGGGVRKVSDAAELLAAGSDKVAVNTAAVLNPDLLREMAEQFGRQCVVASIDAVRRGDSGWDVVIHAGTKRLELDAVEYAKNAVRLGAGEILLTSFDRDGTGDGYDLALIEAVRAAVNVPVIASGGAGSVADMRDALDAGADAVLAATIFHDKLHGVADVKAELFGTGGTPC